MFEGLLSKIYKYVIGVLVILLLGTSISLYATSNKLETCKEQRVKDKLNYEKASLEAEVAQRKAIKDKEDEYREKAKKADADYGALVNKYRDAVSVYQRNQSTSSRAATSSNGTSTKGDNRSGEDTLVPNYPVTSTELDITEVVVVPVYDLEVCAENTARLVIAREWALKLNE